MVEDFEPFAWALLLVAGAVLVAPISNRIGSRLRIPAPAIFLLGAAASDLVPTPGQGPIATVEEVVTVPSS